jgi:hypothetical protein
MNATFNPARLPGLAAFTAGHRWFAPPAKFRDHVHADQNIELAAELTFTFH